MRKLAHNFTYPDEKIIQYKYLGQRLFLCCIGFAPGGRFSYDDQPWLGQANALCSKGAPVCRSFSCRFYYFFIYGCICRILLFGIYYTWFIYKTRLYSFNYCHVGGFVYCQQRRFFWSRRKCWLISYVLCRPFIYRAWQSKPGQVCGKIGSFEVYPPFFQSVSSRLLKVAVYNLHSMPIATPRSNLLLNLFIT